MRNSRGVDEDDDDENDYDEELLDKDLTRTYLKEACLKLIFEPYGFSRSNMHKALGVSYIWWFEILSWRVIKN